MRPAGGTFGSAPVEDSIPSSPMVIVFPDYVSKERLATSTDEMRAVIARISSACRLIIAGPANLDTFSFAISAGRAYRHWTYVPYAVGGENLHAGGGLLGALESVGPEVCRTECGDQRSNLSRRKSDVETDGSGAESDVGFQAADPAHRFGYPLEESPIGTIASAAGDHPLGEHEEPLVF